MADRTSTNEEILAAYDANETIESRKLDTVRGMPEQHAGQIIVFEMLRILMREWTMESYTNMTNDEWDVVRLDAVRAAQAIDAYVEHLTLAQTQEAANMGNNYYEATYAVLMAGDRENDYVSLQKWL